MADEPVRTFVASEAGELPFQDYFVRRRCEPVVFGFRFDGAERARPPRVLHTVIQRDDIEGVVFCPSNPFISIGPILAVRGIRDWLEARRFLVVAVSPIIGGQAVKGPAAKMFRELGFEASALAVARHYGALVDGWVIDEQDAREARDIEALGKHVVMTNTLMTDRTRSIELAQSVIDLTRTAGVRR
jgi:LPPG:FO 2-phospho-L-lactate transferase